MRQLARRLLGIEVNVTKGEATELAKAECERRGWPWTEPVAVLERLAEYRVWTNSGKRGGNVVIRVDIQTGKIRRATYAER
jgi:hypothetical protein